MKQQLLKKAELLFLRYGIRSVSMDDLAKELGVSKKTLYIHVENKTELVRQIFALRCDEEDNAIDEFKGKSDNAIAAMVDIAKFMIDRLRLMSPSFRYDLEKYYPTIFKELEDFHQTYVLEHTEENLLRGKTEGLYRENIDVTIISRLFMGMINNIGHDQLFPVHEFPLDGLLRHSFLYHLHGIISEKGRVILEEYLSKDNKEYL